MKTQERYIDHFLQNARSIIFIVASVFGFLISGCLRTEGTLTLKGKITDQLTNEQIPNRRVIIHARVSRMDKFVPVYAGQFITDSAGCFNSTISRISGAYDYDFSLVGDTDYLFTTERLSLFGLVKNGEFLSFKMRRLTELKIKINRDNDAPDTDTLYLYWESDGNNGRGLASYKVVNYGNSDNYLGSSNYPDLRWIGGKVKSQVNTRVFADKWTIIYFELIRNGKRQVITDTITCRRKAENEVYFKY